MYELAAVKCNKYVQSLETAVVPLKLRKCLLFFLYMMMTVFFFMWAGHKLCILKNT